jgi:uncharacterized protein DUF1353
MRETALQVSRRNILKNVASFSLALLSPHAAIAAGRGEFKGSVVARWTDNGRDMILTQPFEYIAPDSKRWPVPSGTTVDGASIPRIFWSAIGGPFEGQYRNASVVHDFYCKVRTRPYRDVHRMFYDAMLTSGVQDTKSWFMYQAVDQFGPKWTDPKIDPKCEVVDENYDFKRCARNFAKPALEQPTIDRSGLEEFLSRMESRADPADIAELRKQLPNLR